MSDEAAAERMDMAIKTGEQFSERYYKILDQERHKINTMYHENAVLAWNGNPVEGIGSIKSFMMEKLPKTNTFLNSLDAQPVHDSAVQGKTTVLVVVSVLCTSSTFLRLIENCNTYQVSGTMKFGSTAPKPFQQNFMLTDQDQKWKVVTDTYRSQ